MAILSKKYSVVDDEPVLLYTVPAGKTAAIAVQLCNQSQRPARAGIALRLPSETGFPTVYDYIKSNQVLQPEGGDYECAGLILAAGEKVYGVSSVVDTNFIVIGVEE